MELKKIAKAIAKPFVLTLYAILWIAIQPVILSGLYDLTSSLFSAVRQAIVLTVFLIVNGVWLISWYKITLRVRDSSLRGR